MLKSTIGKIIIIIAFTLVSFVFIVDLMNLFDNPSIERLVDLRFSSSAFILSLVFLITMYLMKRGER